MLDGACWLHRRMVGSAIINQTMPLLKKEGPNKIDRIDNNMGYR